MLSYYETAYHFFSHFLQRRLFNHRSCLCRIPRHSGNERYDWRTFHGNDKQCFQPHVYDIPVTSGPPPSTAPPATLSSDASPHFSPSPPRGGSCSSHDDAPPRSSSGRGFRTRPRGIDPPASSSSIPGTHESH